MKAAEVVFKSVRELSELVQARQVSPLELSEVFLDRLERIGPDYNAVVTVTRERALEQAKRAEQQMASGHSLGMLHGIPFGGKDLLAVAGLPTTWGAAPFRNRVFEYDATVVRKLEDAGAVLCAKLAMVELAGGMGYRQPNASFTGPGRNPWDRYTWTGGSSNGSGAAVAAGLVPFAIGSETWGSILSPANNCGLAGLRPTYGRVSRHGAMALSWTLDKLGPLCLTADDCGLVLEAIAGPDPDDQTTTDREFRYDDTDVSSRRFRLAILKGALDDLDEDVRANTEAVLGVLKEFADIQEIEFPDLPYETVTRTILSAESASAFEDFFDDGGPQSLTAPEDRHPYARTAISAQDYIKALRIRGKIARVADELMAPYDAVVAPTRATPATRIDQDFRTVILGSARDTMGAVGNSAGLPAISVPSGFSRSGLPTGIQFMGRAYDENKVIAVARAYQIRTDWHMRHPKAVMP